MAVRIGANPIGWSNDDMRELGGHISLEQCLTDAKAAGFEGMELGNKFPRQVSTLKSVMSAHDLDLIGRLVFDVPYRARCGERVPRGPAAHAAACAAWAAACSSPRNARARVHGDRRSRSPHVR